MSLPSISDTVSLIITAKQPCAVNGFRLPVVLAGDEAWASNIAAELIESAAKLLWLGEGSPEGVEPQTFATARTWLGRELDVVVINAYSGLDVDGLGAVSGTVRAGGMLILLTPPLDGWQNFVDPEHAKLAVAGYAAESISGRMLARLARMIREDEQLLLIEQNQPLPAPPKLPQTDVSSKSVEPYATIDQQQAVEKILQTLPQENPVPLVMTADRGRGKSAALGLAAGQLLQQQNIRIGISGPRLAAVEQVFVHAAKLCADAKIQRNRIHLSHSRLDYFAPDELIREQPPLDVLLVDEAATIPAPMLAQLLALYPRIIFSSTLHGYEGSGRGFALRFRQTLDQQAPGWQAITLNQPVRWAQGDPLEQWIFRALLLDVDLRPALANSSPKEALQIRLVERDDLLADEVLLREVFALLVWAHYQTRPQDLRNLLDGPAVQVVVAMRAGQVVATMLLTDEGGFDQAMAGAIVRGERRPRGHLVPQSLALHSGFEQAAELRYARVMRVAVHPQVQRQGVGKAMLTWLATYRRDVDVLCASFGATSALLRFWMAQEYRPLRLGFSRDQASGCHSVIVARPVSAAGENCVEKMHQRLAQSLPLLRREALRDLEPELIDQLPAEFPASLMAAQDWLDVRAFVAGQRGFDSCLLGLWRWWQQLLPQIQNRSQSDSNLLNAKLIEALPWADLVEKYGFAGRQAAIKELERAVARLLESYKLTDYG
ncbi:MAG: GNAT family N-acetyltransferase [Gammaproteobacteria bacterium]|nr:GNAT family N-acetyltransferase [Gammaproteobacteria bacterium]